MRIAVDFDGTLCVDKYPQIGMPRIDNIKWVKNQISKGHQVFLNTVRSENEELLMEALHWCKNQGIIFSGILFNKAHVDIFFDDKNMKLEDITKIRDCKDFKRG